MRVRSLRHLEDGKEPFSASKGLLLLGAGAHSNPRIRTIDFFHLEFFDSRLIEHARDLTPPAQMLLKMAQEQLDKEVKNDYSIIMELSNYTKIFKALSNEQRLKIFIMLYKNCCTPEGTEIGAEFRIDGEPCCPIAGGIERAFTRICDCMNLSRSTISHHFKELQNAGLITCERDGQLYRCRVNKEVIESMKKFLD